MQLFWPLSWCQVWLFDASFRDFFRYNLSELADLFIASNPTTNLARTVAFDGQLFRSCSRRCHEFLWSWGFMDLDQCCWGADSKGALSDKAFVWNCTCESVCIPLQNIACKWLLYITIIHHRHTMYLHFIPSPTVQVYESKANTYRYVLGLQVCYSFLKKHAMSPGTGTLLVYTTTFFSEHCGSVANGFFFAARWENKWKKCDQDWPSKKTIFYSCKQD